MRNPPSIDLANMKFSDRPDTRAIAERMVANGASARDVGTFLGFLDDLGSEKAPTNPFARFTTSELKAELIRRGCVDFSKWEVAIKMGPWLVLILAFTLLKLSETLDGTLLACFLK
jgi:hypothetical protein